MGTTLPPLGRFSYLPHAHECDNCRYIWAHDPDGIKGRPEAIFDRAHSCPQCGTPVTHVYMGQRHPAVIHDGLGRDHSLRSVPVQYVEKENETRRMPPEAAARLALMRLFGYFD